VALVATQLLLASASSSAAVPYGWPEGWSDVDQLGSVTRYAPHLCACACWESQTVHIMWVGDGPGGPSTTLVYSRVDLSTGLVAVRAQVVYQLERSGTIDALDFVATQDTLHAVWVEQRGGDTGLVRGELSLSTDDLRITSTHQITSTGYSVVDPHIFVSSQTRYVAWSDSREGSLDVYLLAETSDGDSPGPVRVTSGATASTQPFVFVAAGVKYIGWVEQIGEVRRELRVSELDRGATGGGPIRRLSFTVGSPAVAPAAYAGPDSLDLLLTLRTAGRDSIVYVQTSRWLAMPEPWARQAAEVGESIMTSRGIHDVGFRIPAHAEDRLVFVFSRADTGNRLGVWEATVNEDGTVATQKLTPDIAGAFEPIMFEDAAGNRHLLFLAVQPDMSATVNYMNTVSPAEINYWSLVGVDSDHLLVSLIGRFITVAALALATLLPNAMLLIMGGVLLFLVGSRVRRGDAWIPGVLLAGLTTAWYYVPFAPLLYYGGYFPRQSEVLVAAVLACSAATAFLWLRRKQWHEELLTIVFIDCLWLFWFFLFTLLRS